jgi:hypothetical protein
LIDLGGFSAQRQGDEGDYGEAKQITTLLLSKSELLVVWSNVYADGTSGLSDLLDLRRYL